MRENKKVFQVGVAIFPVLFLLLLFTGCKPQGRKNGKKKDIPVVASTVVKGDIEHKIRLNGEIKGQNQADIYSDVPGKVLNILVREGQRVFRGQIVATVDRSQVGMVYMPASVRSPITGIIGKIFVDRGQTVSMQTPIMMVADTRFVEGVVHIPEKYVPLFRIGQQAEIRTESFPGKVFKGRVYKVASMIDPATRTLQVRLRLYNMRGRLIPGNYADFSVIVRKYPGQVLASFDAIMDSLEYTDVFVIEKKEIPEKGEKVKKLPTPTVKKGKKSKVALKLVKKRGKKARSRIVYIARRRRVVVGIREGKVVQILSGLKPGERIVTMGKENIIEGSHLKIKEMVKVSKDNGGEAQ